MNGPHYQQGNYIGQVVQQGLSKASTGNTQFVLRVKVLGYPSEDGSLERDPFQYERTIYLTITAKTIDFIADTLEVLGYNRPGFGPLDPSHSQHQSFVGKEVELYCTHENDQNGNPREKWRISRGVMSKALELKPLNQKELRELDSLYGKSIRSSAAPAPAPVKAQAPAVRRSNSTTATEITDEDIPF